MCTVSNPQTNDHPGGDSFAATAFGTAEIWPSESSCAKGSTELTQPINGKFDMSKTEVSLLFQKFKTHPNPLLHPLFPQKHWYHI